MSNQDFCINHLAAQLSVRDQGQRPTCVGFAVSAAHEWMAGDNTELSPEDAIWAGHKAGGDNNVPETSVQLALSGLSNHGHSTEVSWPYGAPPWPSDRPKAAALPSNQRNLPGWRRLPKLTMRAVRHELTQGLAVVLTLGFVYASWSSPNGIVHSITKQAPTGNHAVLAVGAVRIGEPQVDHLIIRNSWGSDWGIGGYGLVSEDYLETHGVVGHVLEDH